MGSVEYSAASTCKKGITTEKVFHIVICDVTFSMARNFNYFIVYLKLRNINFIAVLKSCIDKIVFIFLRGKDFNIRIFFVKLYNAADMICVMVCD